VKEKWGRLGQVAVAGAGVLTGVGVARWKAWPAVEKCLLKCSIIVSQNFLEFVLQGANLLMFPKMFGNAILCFPKCLCILVPNFPEKLHIAGAI
jgi:hypothetical protein